MFAGLSEGWNLRLIPIPSSFSFDSKIAMDPNISVIPEIQFLIQSLDKDLRICIDFEHPFIENEFKESVFNFRTNLRSNALVMFPHIVYDELEVDITITRFPIYFDRMTIDARDLHLYGLWALQHRNVEPEFNYNRLETVCKSIDEWALNTTQLKTLNLSVAQNGATLRNWTKNYNRINS